ncbi:surface-adhesin E family protein [Sphingomonas sp. G-3-2-10]|uniref:surface-adhesin E family protein n=1 Tax=Sphingomonas sp. G-3-2-10 TaxID=2728838 RepID=UPI001469E130|nr:surface-adhesin E family protein [Sphingomonas sp. G-3-2-10]NML05009.1 hypothetical protein [Sphingomonas sp. G-3-2-10]
MKPTHLLAAIALLAPGTAFAQASDWRFVDVTASGTERESLMLVDAKSVTNPAKDIREAWNSNVFARNQDLGNGTLYSELRIKYRFDCAANTFAIRDIRILLDGTAVTETSTEGEAKVINPGTPAAKMAAAVCSGNFSGFAPARGGTPNTERRARFGG